MAFVFSDFVDISTLYFFFFFSSRRRHTRSLCDWSSDVCSSDLPEAISRTLAELIQPEARGRLLALGLARGMIWRDGIVPAGAPDRLNSSSLTPDRKSVV